MANLLELDRSQWCTPLPSHDPSGGRVFVTSPYGIRNGGLHAGTDEGSTDGLDLFSSTHAMADGVIDGRGNALPNAAGLWVWLRTRIAYDGGVIGIKYFHLAEHVAVTGQQVECGEMIAKAGGSGGFPVHAHVQFHVLRGRSNDWTDGNSLNNTPFLQALINDGWFPRAKVVTPPTEPYKPPAAQPQEITDMLAHQPCYSFGEDGNQWSGLTYWADNAGRLHHVPDPEVLDRMSQGNQGHPAILAPGVWLDRDSFISQIRAFDPALADELAGKLAA